MGARPWSKFFWNDWRGDPGLRASSLSARGLWIEMLCIAAEADPTGYVLVNGRTPSTTDLARMTGEPEAVIQSALEELDRNGVFSRDRKGRIYSRRLVRDEKSFQINHKNGKMGGNPSLSKQRENPPPVNPPLNGEDKTQKPEARSQKESTPSKSPPASGDVIEFEFGEFWRVYPRREDRGHALKAFRTARKKVDQASLMAATKRYAGSRNGQDQKYTALASTWLNGERWADEQSTEPQRNGGFIPMHPGAGG